MNTRHVYYYYIKLGENNRVFCLTRAQRNSYLMRMGIPLARVLHIGSSRVSWQDIPGGMFLCRCKKDGSWYKSSPAQIKARRFNQLKGQTALASGALNQLPKEYPFLGGQVEFIQKMIKHLRESLEIEYYAGKGRKNEKSP